MNDNEKQTDGKYEQHGPDGVLIGDRIIGYGLDIIVTGTYSATGVSPPFPFGCRVIRKPNDKLMDPERASKPN